MITYKPDNFPTGSTSRNLARTQARDHSRGPRTSVNVIAELHQSVARRATPPGAGCRGRQIIAVSRSPDYLLDHPCGLVRVGRRYQASVAQQLQQSGVVAMQVANDGQTGELFWPEPELAVKRRGCRAYVNLLIVEDEQCR
jgi:hypothetical protein